MKVVVIITSRGRGDQIMKHCAKINLAGGVSFIGKGTAPSEILDKLLIGDSNKDVILSIANDKDIEDIFDFLESKYQFTKKGRGVAFTIPLSSITEKSNKYLEKQLGENLNV